MAALQCDICGGKLMAKPGGIFECGICGIQYDTAWAKAKLQADGGSVSTANAPHGASVTLENMLKRGHLALEDREWSAAAGFFDQALNLDPESAVAYLGKLMAELHCNRQEDLAGWDHPLNWNKNYEKVLRFADENLRSTLEGYQAQILRREEEEAREQARQREEAALARENKRLEFREKVASVQQRLSANDRHTAALRADGKALATKYLGYHDPGHCVVDHWTGLTAISAGTYHTLGLRFDGRAVATRYTGLPENDEGQYNVHHWTDLVAISAGGYHSVGLTEYGSVVAVGNNQFGQCNVSDWAGITAISAGNCHTVGLTEYGTVVATGDNNSGQCDVDDWVDIVAISAGSLHTLGLKADGTVVSTEHKGESWSNHGQGGTAGWKDIVAISAGGCHSVGLTVDGTVVAVGRNDDGQCRVGSWTDVVAVSTASFHTVCLKKDGTVLATGLNSCGQCVVNDWRLFRDLDTLEADTDAARIRWEEDLKRQQEEQQRALERQRKRDAGLCQHCGGEFKGFFSKKCTSCGRPKDY